jgi:purine-binding chemotaxis protein CheW
MNESYILFELGGSTYGLSSREVQHMEMLQHITPVPNAPPFVEGVVYSRGQVIPAVNLRRRFGLAPQGATLRSRLIVVQAGQRRVGLIVDSAREFRTISAESILSPEEAVAGISGKYLQGIVPMGERLVFLLNVSELLRETEAETQRRLELAQAAP